MKWMHDRVDAWRNNPAPTGPLHTFLGMSPELYARWEAEPQPYVLGLDEVGYGALAGPLVIGAVLAPAAWTHESLRDSKWFRGNRKEFKRAAALAKIANEQETTYYIHRTSNERIDAVGAFKARNQAFLEVCQAVLGSRDGVLVVIDGDERVAGLEHVCLPKADTFVPQVMAASILAKVARDTEMIKLHEEYPKYDLATNKGYGSPVHQDAIVRYGLCPLHRRSYKLRFLPATAGTQ